MSLTNIINEFVVEDVSKSIKFYEDNFGFSVDFTDGDPVNWAQLKKDNYLLMLVEYNTAKDEINSLPEKTNSSNLIKFEYSSLQEIKDIYNNLKKNNIEFFTDYTEMDYGKAEFGVYDIDKNMILVAAPLE